jgi:hypothetical protein
MNTSDLSYRVKWFLDDYSLQNIIKLNEFEIILDLIIDKLFDRTTNFYCEKGEIKIVFSLKDDDCFIAMYNALYNYIQDNKKYLEYIFDDNLFIQLDKVRRNYYLKLFNNYSIDTAMIRYINSFHYDVLIDNNIYIGNNETTYFYVDYLVFLNGNIIQINKLYFRNITEYSLADRIRLSINICKNINIDDDKKVAITLKICSQK